MESGERSVRIAVVIPAYKVSAQILEVIRRVGPEVQRIIVVDDGCPEGTGKLVESQAANPRLEVLFHQVNQGVGAAVVSGYRRALDHGADIVVKLDGDGQMAPEQIAALIMPIVVGEADYVKGNRFFNPEDLGGMPPVRLLGNAALSFLTKLSSGYWSIFDPTNGFTAIHAGVLPILRMDRLAPRYFFESDMLFRLNLLRCKVIDVPLPAIYGSESSNLSVRGVLLPFFWRNCVNFHKRMFYNYFVRNFSVASLYLLFGILLSAFGTAVGIDGWHESLVTGVARPTGTIMLATLPLLIGLQLILAFVGFDVSMEPDIPIHPRLARLQAGAALLTGASAEPSPALPLT